MLQKFNVFLSLLVCLLLAGLVVTILLSDNRIGGSEEDEPDKTPRILTVESASVSPSDKYSVRRTYTGIIRSSEAVDLGFSRAGRIAEILVDKGDQVKEGDPLAELDMDRLEQQTGRARTRSHGPPRHERA